MRIVFGAVLVIGLGLAGFAAMKTSEYISASQARERAALQRVVPTVDVFVARKELPFGHVLTPEDVVRIAWPKNAVPERAFQDGKLLFPEGENKARTVIRQMEKFEPLLTSKLTEPGADGGINTRLSQGMRAFSIRIDVASGVSGLVRVGDRVDVYWTGSSADLTDEVHGEFTRIIESGIGVIGIDQNSQDGYSGVGRTITVEATPQQVARLAQAQATGRLALALMGVADEGGATVSDVDRRELLGFAAPEAAPVADQPCTIRTRKGGDVVEIPIPCTN